MDLTSPVVFFTALVVGFVCSQAGVSGAFLLLPFQISYLGFVTPSVNSTNFMYNIISIPGGVYKYWREKRMLWHIVFILVVGYLPGIYLGSWVRINYLLNPKVFKLFVGIVLLYFGARLLKASILKPSSSTNSTSDIWSAEVIVKEANFRKITFEFLGKEHSFSPLTLFLLSLVVGVVGGAYGVGGGFLMSPILVVVFGLPVYTIAGATLFGTLVSSVIGIFSYCSLGYLPDLKIGLLLGFGGLIGIYLGARVQIGVPEKIIQLILSALVLFLSVKYISQYWL